MISQIAQCVRFLTKAFIVPFFLILLLKACFGGAVGIEVLKAQLFPIFLLSQKPDPKEKTSHNL
jgi:hypothetical protein